MACDGREEFECENCGKVVHIVCITRQLCIGCHSPCSEDDFPTEEEWEQIKRENENGPDDAPTA
jgi:hypothetical protein